MGVWASGIGCCGATSASAIVKQVAHSRTRDRRQGITRERVNHGREQELTTQTYLLCPMADMRSGAVFSRGEVSCRINCIEQNVAVIWRRSVAPSPHFAPPQPKCEPTIRGCQSTTARGPRPRSWARWPTGDSHFDCSDLTDGRLAHAAYR